MDEPVIEFRDVHTSYGPKHVLRGVSFGMPRHGITVMLGPSGAGKTTCIRNLVALQQPHQGQVMIEGQSVWDLSHRQLAAFRKRTGVLLQGAGVYGSALWESMTVRENVCHQLREVTKLKEDEIQARAGERIAEVGLAAQADELPDVLSAGSRKRVAIARALAADPDYAILDGFELGIDGVRLMKLCTLVRERQQRVGTSMLIVTQDLEVARELADHVVVLFGGTIAAEGPADEVFASGDVAVAQLLSGGRRGPISLAETVPAASPTPRSANLYDIPLWLAALGLLAMLSGSVIFFSNPSWPELVVLAAIWAAVLGVFVRRSHRRS